MIAKDKVQHFVAGIAIACFGLGVSWLSRGALRPSDGAALALLAGIAKEVYDYTEHRKAMRRAVDEDAPPPARIDTTQSVLDAVATTAGGVVVAVAAGLITGMVV